MPVHTIKETIDCSHCKGEGYLVNKEIEIVRGYMDISSPPY